MDPHFDLIPEDFGPAPRRIARSGVIEVTARRAPSGVCVLRVETPRAQLDLLPFHGQQIWDARIDGRCLTMKSLFDTPRNSRDYLENYGAFFLHCGGSSLGNPGPADRHPLHGELPNARYDRATLVLSDHQVGLTGELRLTRAFSHDVIFRPTLRLGADATLIEMGIEVDNRAATPFDWYYLAHVNFRPADGGRLIDTVADDLRDILQRPAPGIPMVAIDQPLDRSVPPPLSCDPERLHVMQVAEDGAGWALALQQHPDGSGDLVHWRPGELPRITRWISRRPDEDAMGFALPGTAWPTGLADLQAKGQQVIIPPKGRWRADFSFGLVPAAEMPALAAEARDIREARR